METTELRIGNLVSIPDHEVWSWEFSREDWDCYEWHQIKPIPLTKECLFKFGFEKSELYIRYGNGADWQPEYPRSTFESYSLKVHEDKYIAIVYVFNEWKNKYSVIESDTYIQLVCGYFYPTKIDSSDFIDCIIPEYIHQLQNLYSALTGKELEWKK